MVDGRLSAECKVSIGLMEDLDVFNVGRGAEALSIAGVMHHVA